MAEGTDWAARRKQISRRRSLRARLVGSFGHVREERNVTCLLFSRHLLSMKNFLLLGVFALLAASIAGQSPGPDQSSEVQALMKQVQAQQIQLAENQAKIDAKLAEV